jgi:hypothetical protein
MQMLRLLEPKLLLGHNQAIEDPRDGLSLFGPLDVGRTHGIRQPSSERAPESTDSGTRSSRFRGPSMTTNCRAHRSRASRPHSMCHSARAVCSNGLLKKKVYQRVQHRRCPAGA